MQSALEGKYREKLAADFGIQFSNLFTLSNMPIKRFADFLHRRGELAQCVSLSSFVFFLFLSFRSSFLFLSAFLALQFSSSACVAVS